jgi:hypothetical protein
MAKGNTQTGTQTTSSAPWGPAQGHLKGILGDAKQLYNQDTGFQAYGTGNGKKPWAEFSGQTQNALGTMEGLASNPNPFYGGAKNFTQGLLGGQYAHDQSGYQGLMGQGPSTEGDYRSMLDGENEAYNQVRQTTANTIGDQLQRQWGGASFGSGGNADYVTRGVGNVLAQMDSDNYFQRQGMKQGLLNNITGVQQQNFDNTRGLLGDMSNLDQMDIGNRMGGLSMMDSVYNSQYLPAERMAGVGGAYDAKANEILTAKMDRYNTNQMAPWDRLTQYFGLASGTGSQGNRATTTTSQPTDIFSKLLGGGLLASQIF